MSDEPKRYFSERHGRGPKAQPLAFEQVRKLVLSAFDSFEARGYVQEAFGYECVDAGYVAGTLGYDVAAFFLRTTMRENIWPWRHEPLSSGDFAPADETFEPPPDNWETWDADTLFDVIEVMHDVVSEPVTGRHHTYNDCGWHYETFNRTAGQEKFRREISQVLRLGDPAYEIDGLGQIVESAPDAFRSLLSAPVPNGTEHDLITSRIDAAVKRFRTRGASIDDRRHAVRDLADVLEALRPDVKENMLSADENALFHVANGFAVRHNNRDQRGDYDRLTWLRWAFYVYLATIHAVLRVRNVQRRGQ